MAIKKELVDELLKGVDPKAVFSSEGLLSGDQEGACRADAECRARSAP